MRSARIGLLVLAVSMLGGDQASAATTCQFTTIGHFMFLKGNCTTDASILIPDGFFLDGRGHTITAIDPALDHFRGAILQNAPGADYIHIRNVTLTTSALAETVCDTGDEKLRAIALLNAGGSVRNVNIINIGQGGHLCAEGSGVVANNAPFDGTHPATKLVLIDNVRVRGFQYVGLQAAGDLRAWIKDSRVVGSLDPAIPTDGQFGIYVAQGATATVHGNNVDLDPNSTNIALYGIIFDDADHGEIVNNTVDGPYHGIFVIAFCRFPQLSANRNVIIDNHITALNEGVSLVARSFVGPSACDAHADRNLVLDNKISATPFGPAGHGVYVGTQNLNGGFTPVAHRNLILFNRITGFNTGIFRSGDTGTIVFGNIITP